MPSEGRRRHEMAPEEEEEEEKNKKQISPENARANCGFTRPALLACRRTCICTHALITARRAASSSTCNYYQRADVNNKLHSSVNRQLSLFLGGSRQVQTPR